MQIDKFLPFIFYTITIPLTEYPESTFEMQKNREFFFFSKG